MAERIRVPKRFLSAHHWWWWYGQYQETDHWIDTSTDYKRRHPYCQMWWLHWLTFWWPKKWLECHHKHYRTLGRERDRDLMTACNHCHWLHHKIKRVLKALKS